MLEFALFTVMAVSHIKIRTAFIHMSIWTMLSFQASLSHEILAYFEIMTEIAALTIRTITFRLIFLTSLNFTLIMRIGTCLPLPTFPMDEFLTDTIGCELRRIIIIDGWSRDLYVIAGICVHCVVAGLWIL